MLNLKKVLTAKPKPRKKGNDSDGGGPSDLKPLLTPWGEDLQGRATAGEDLQGHVGICMADGRFATAGEDLQERSSLSDMVPLPQHPRPQAQRETWRCLNGFWTCAFTQDAPAPEALPLALPGKRPPAEGIATPILVPFSPESLLSGVNRQLQPNELLWYEHTFDAPDLPAGWRLMLNFEAVDYACAVWLNNQLLGTHAGGYLPFSFDVTDALVASSSAAATPAVPKQTTFKKNVLRLCVADPSDAGTQPRGKQRLGRGDIWYTAQSGIWQTVWLEWMPAEGVGAFSLDASYDAIAGQGILQIDCKDLLEVFAYDSQGRLVAQGNSQEPLVVKNVIPWSPDDPYLYQIELVRGQDRVQSYCGFRSVAVRRAADGHRRVFLNGRQIFLKGVLDQGYWPDGLMTAPADEALVHDIATMKEAGFNLLRKHIKVECARWYYHADRLGMLVWQDMVCGGGAQNVWHTSYKPTLLRASWDTYGDTSASHQRNLHAGDAGYRRAWTQQMEGTLKLLGSHPCIISWVLFNEGWGQFDARKAWERARTLDGSRPIVAVTGWYDQHCGDFKSVHNYFRPLAVWPDKRGKRAFVVGEFGGLTLAVPKHMAFDEAYGYETFTDGEAWQKGVLDLLGRMDALEPQGLAGYVYTQLSDVEEEVNGLVTYDRRVNKLRLSAG